VEKDRRELKNNFSCSLFELLIFVVFVLRFVHKKEKLPFGARWYSRTQSLIRVALRPTKCLKLQLITRARSGLWQQQLFLIKLTDD
jgi:hypothetical protein